MSFCIAEDGQLEAAPTPAPPRECPHCHTVARMTPIARPDFDMLKRLEPRRIGLVYRCDQCGAPRFLRYTVRRYLPDRIELAEHGHEIERLPEKFSFSYLPDEVRRLFREALACYSADCFDAFASMCRRTARAAFDDLGETGRMRMFNTLDEIRELCGLDDATYQRLQATIFGADHEPYGRLPDCDAATAAVLLEAMKDLLYQVYVRVSKLRKAVEIRRYFAEESARKITPIRAAQRLSREAGSA
jgi:hypothetical protein